MSEETAAPPQFKIAWLLGILAAFAIFAAIAGYSARMTDTYTSYDEERATVRKDTLVKVQKSENDLLYPVDKQGHPTAVWADEAKGIIRIPIDQAMALELDSLQTKAPAAGNEINPPAPAPAPAAAPAKPAPGAAPAAPAPTAPAAPKQEKK